MSDISFIGPGIPGAGAGTSGGYGSLGPINRNGATAPTTSASAASAANLAPPVPGTAEVADSILASTGGDRVEVSNFARYLDQIRRLPEVRLDRIAAARKAIAQGVYDNDDVLDRTIERMAEEEAL